MKRIKAGDLFCGLGGTSTGLFRAAEQLGLAVDLSAVNHWERAIETHAANHPTAVHFCQNLANMDPRKAVPGGKLDLLVASPECTHHSVARGGMPINDQSRASAYCVHRWCAALEVKRVLIENVPEFTSWGPLKRMRVRRQRWFPDSRLPEFTYEYRPDPKRKGELFAAYLQTFRAMGYRVEWRILNAADYGGATTRRRLFIQCAKGRLPIRWPEPTHEADPKPGLVEPLAKWRAAREIIDWSVPGQSIFTRKRPLSPNTLKRIAAGLTKFGGAAADPFLILLRRHADGRSLDLPLPTLTAGGEHVALCEPFVIGTSNPNGNGSYVYGQERPLPTVTSANDLRLVEPFVMRACNGGDDNCRVKSPDEPLGTIHASGGSFGIVEPFLVSAGGPEVGARPISQPANTVLTRDHMGLVEPFIIPTNYGERPGQAPRCHDIDKPMPTVVAGGMTHGIVEPFIVPQNTSNNPRSVDDPAPTVTTTSRGVGLCEPFLVPFYANGQADSPADPLRTVTTKDRHALVEPDRCRLDIRFRMLQPHELAAAMGFPRDYKITGNRGDQVKQIGNAVEVYQATALILAMLEDAA